MIHFLSETKAVAGAARVPRPGVPAAQTLHSGEAVAPCPSRGGSGSLDTPLQCHLWDSFPLVLPTLIPRGSLHGSRECQQGNECCWQENCPERGLGHISCSVFMGKPSWQERLPGDRSCPAPSQHPCLPGFPGEVSMASSLCQQHCHRGTWENC